jgi:hypothetical protein
VAGRRWEKAWEGVYSADMCVHMYVSGEMRCVETIPGMGRRRDEGEWWRG